jgi:propionyl-CoA:succinyl-CoA transferase
MRLPFPVLTAQDAAAMIKHGQTVGFSAFTPAGSAKAIPRAIAERAKTEHAAGQSYQIRVLTGASTGESLEIPPFEMYSEILQDAVIDLIQAGRCTFASATALTVTSEIMDQITGNIPFFRRHLILRPQEISNNPEIVRRLGIISINTALEVDLFGNVNSTHLMGTQLMNGIGGSADFTRNAYISIFTCPSVEKNGKISTIVPLVTHVDHSEHSVQVVVTEWGVADLRGKDERERAQLIINNCAHPDYRDELQSYVDTAKEGHSLESLTNAFAMHRQFLKTGDMRGTQWN